MTKKAKTTNHIAKAHDHFFRTAMSDKRVAKEFFETHLPNELKAIVALEHLEIQSGTFIDDFRQESIADMLFKTRIGGNEAFLYLLVDHQSQPDELMPFRILKYTNNIIDQHLKDTGKKRIPLILPMVVYHGSISWNYSTNINDLIDAPKHLIDRYFLKPFTLIDLNKIDDAVIKSKVWSGVMELTLKHIFERDMLPFLPDIMKILQEIERHGGKNLVESVLIYILDRGEVDKEKLVSLVKDALSEEVGEKVMTVAEQFKKEERLIIAKRLLSEKLEDAFIVKITELSLEEIKKLKETLH